MTLAEFRNNKSLMKEASKVRAIPVVQTMLDVLWQEHILFMSGSAMGLPTDDKTLRLGHLEGYNRHHQNLLSMFEPPVEPFKMPKEKYLPLQ